MHREPMTPLQIAAKHIEDYIKNLKSWDLKRIEVASMDIAKIAFKHFEEHQYPTADAYEAVCEALRNAKACPICGGVCPVCGGDCFEANPPVTNCPIRRNMGIRK